MDASFKFATESVSISIEGPEDFLRPHVEFLMPFVRRTTGAPVPVEEGPVPTGIDGVGVWWHRTVPAHESPSLQETILLFGWYMRTYRKTVFMSEDIRRCFAIMGMDEPRSLLQILGTMKRDNKTLLNAGKRGEYMMNMPGINRVKEILGEAATAAPPAPVGGGPTHAPDARSLFRV